MLRNNKQSRCGFSLIEMMVALVIVALIMSFSVAGFSHITGATELTGTGDHFVGQFTQARQTAITDSAHVEMRLYRPLEDVLESHWSLAMVRQRPDGSYEGLLPPYHLPGGTTISMSPALSTLVSELEMKSDEERLLTSSDSETPLSYVSFRFHPDGSTDLPVNAGGDTWHLTLVTADSVVPDSDAPPKNFYTLRIDPFSGAVRTFRP